MLGMNGGSSDRPEGVSRAQYYAGFAMTIGSSAMYGLVLPLMELSQARLAGRSVGSYSLIVEMQVVMGFTATAFCAVGMIVNKDFQVRWQTYFLHCMKENPIYIFFLYIC
jgi:hypothetical protein